MSLLPIDLCSNVDREIRLRENEIEFLKSQAEKMKQRIEMLEREIEVVKLMQEIKIQRDFMEKMGIKPLISL